MDATNRAMMNVSGLDILGFMGRAGKWTGRLLLRISLGLIMSFRAWNQTQRGKRAMLTLSDHMLKDIGISRVDAIQYARGKSRV